ncbi:hypothetical protein D6D17_09882 [Aureobasidium pullulans]|nr:hypothetical protein D6D17_09882 [Aureobasidium pullulans]
MFAASLHLSCELDDKADYDIWGQSAQGWDACKEDTIVLRFDQKPLCPKTQEKFEAFKEKYEKEGRFAKY